MNILFAGIAAGVGMVVGFLAIYFVLSLWPSLVLWGLVGLILGYFAKSRKEVVLTGIIYGFFLSVSFLYFCFSGAADQIVPMILLTLALSVIGVLGGIISTVIGNFAKPYLTLERTKKYY